MIARSSEDNIPDPLIVQTEVAWRIGGTRPRSPLPRRWKRRIIAAIGLRSRGGSGGAGGWISEVGGGVVSRSADSARGIDTVAAAKWRGLDDALKADGGQEGAVEVPIVDAVCPYLVRAGARQGREDEEDDQQVTQ